MFHEDCSPTRTIEFRRSNRTATTASQVVLMSECRWPLRRHLPAPPWNRPSEIGEGACHHRDGKPRADETGGRNPRLPLQGNVLADAQVEFRPDLLRMRW